MTYLAASLPAVVMRASPVGQPPMRRHSARIAGPPAAWIAPSTPPPPSRLELAALTMASALTRVMSPSRSWSRQPPIVVSRIATSGGTGLAHTVKLRDRGAKIKYDIMSTCTFGKCKQESSGVSSCESTRADHGRPRRARAPRRAAGDDRGAAGGGGATVHHL